MNKKNNTYLVLFGEERQHPECHLNTKNKFNAVGDARAFSDQFANSTVFKAHFCADSGDLDYIQEVKQY